MLRGLLTGTSTLNHDAEDRPVRVVKEGMAAAIFTYGGDGNRVKSVIGTVTTTFVDNYHEVSSGEIRYPSGCLAPGMC
jgi:hypothetical protein